MGTIRNGGNGAFSGKAGSFIGSSWKNIDYIKGIPKLSKKAASPKQLEQRHRFTIALAFLTPIKDILNMGYASKAGNKSTGANMALQDILGNSITGEYPALAIDPSKVKISKGSLDSPKGVSVVRNGANITVNWYVNLHSSANVDDKALIVAYNPLNDLFLIFENAGTRGLGTADLAMPAEFATEDFVLYFFFQQRDKSRCSDSLYLYAAAS